MNNIISIYGAKSLDRYTDLILRDGFLKKSLKVRVCGSNRRNTKNADAVIYQIHGAPQAAKEDKIIMGLLEREASDKKIVILIHRPDEVKNVYPDFKSLLSRLGSNVALVFLGDKYLNDDFYKVIKNRFIVPHGFFDVNETLQKTPIVVGSHTTWGEMRSIENALKLLTTIFELNNNQFNIVGYLGGKPTKELEINNLEKQWSNLGGNNINFVNATEIIQFNQSTIIVNSSDTEPENFGLTFNVQMYHFKNKIRTGESSGSIHAGVSIPVILEMNGSEIIEDLKVIKVPYSSLNDINSVDYAIGAKKIISCIKDKEYIYMLEHNLLQAKKFNNAFIAKSYIKIFNQI